MDTTNAVIFFNAIGSDVTAKRVAIVAWQNMSMYGQTGALWVWENDIPDGIKECITYEDYKTEYEKLIEL